MLRPVRKTPVFAKSFRDLKMTVEITVFICVFADGIDRLVADLFKRKKLLFLIGCKIPGFGDLDQISGAFDPLGNIRVPEDVRSTRAIGRTFFCQQTFKPAFDVHSLKAVGFFKAFVDTARSEQEHLLPVFPETAGDMNLVIGNVFHRTILSEKKPAAHKVAAGHQLSD